MIYGFIMEHKNFKEKIDELYIIQTKIIKSALLEIFSTIINKDFQYQEIKDIQEETYKNIYTEYIASYLQDQNMLELVQLIKEYGEEEGRKLYELYHSKTTTKSRRRKRKSEIEDLLEDQEYEAEAKSLDEFLEIINSKIENFESISNYCSDDEIENN